MRTSVSVAAFCHCLSALLLTSCAGVDLQGLTTAVLEGGGSALSTVADNGEVAAESYDTTTAATAAYDTAATASAASYDTTSDSYDTAGVPIYGYEAGKAVYGYDATNRPVYDYRALTSSCRVPDMRPRSGAPVRYPRGIRRGAPPRGHGLQHRGGHRQARHDDARRGRGHDARLNGRQPMPRDARRAEHEHFRHGARMEQGRRHGQDARRGERPEAMRGAAARADRARDMRGARAGKMPAARPERKPHDGRKPRPGAPKSPAQKD